MLSTLTMGAGALKGAKGGSSTATNGDYKTGKSGYTGGGFNINAAPAWAGGVSSGGASATMTTEKMALYGAVVLVAGIVAVKWIAKK